MARPPLALPLAALAGFLLLFCLVVTGWAPLIDADTAISDAFRGYGGDHPVFVASLRVLTDVAATLPFLLAGGTASLLLAWRRERRSALFCVAVTVAVPLLWSLQHWLVYWPRPRDGFVVVSSNGFPSGHTTMAASIALTAVLLLWPRLSASVARAGLVLGAVVFAVFIGLTRVALLAHWPVDVIGGWLLALAVVPLAARLVGRPAAPAGTAVASVAVTSTRATTDRE